MAIADLADWLSEWSRTGSVWYLKRLSGNDTLANEAHQAGPYVPKELLFRVFPELHDESRRNPDLQIDARVDSHGTQRTVRAIWYNNRYFGGTRNEARVTGWGGADSPLLDPDSTGALAAFSFQHVSDGELHRMRIWVCRNAAEEDLLEERIGVVEPGHPVIWSPDDDVSRGIGALDEVVLGRCYLSRDQLPREWRESFPAALDVARKVQELRPLKGETADDRLTRRRECEYELFRAIEDAIEGVRVTQGFSSVADFLTHAQRILQRRKARSGKSLELQTQMILIEDGLRPGIDFSHNPESESGKRPDFLFPSESAYKDLTFPAERLYMLAVKTTCRDRWRQILNEADRIPDKHLLTLQEGVSLSQYAEMKNAGVRLVVPTAITDKYPSSIRSELMTLSAFIGHVTPIVGHGA
jgi:hypothetical protein